MYILLSSAFAANDSRAAHLKRGGLIQLVKLNIDSFGRFVNCICCKEDCTYISNNEAGGGKPPTNASLAFRKQSTNAIKGINSTAEVVRGRKTANKLIAGTYDRYRQIHTRQDLYQGGTGAGDEKDNKYLFRADENLIVLYLLHQAHFLQSQLAFKSSQSVCQRNLLALGG